MGFFYDNIIKPALFSLPAETAHEVGMATLAHGLGLPGMKGLARSVFGGSEKLSCERFGLRFGNPIGVAAGFDKNARVVNELAALGFGFVEVGTVTYAPQSGNPKPRLFRLPKDEALINRLGFNNDGAESIASRLRALRSECIVGVNIGKNKDVPNEEALENYLRTFELVHPSADYITVNVSSPNTPNLRELQKAESLEDLLGGIQRRNRELGAKPLLVKIAPDLSDLEIESVAGIALAIGISGIIATNTTLSRSGLSIDPQEAGGLSGRPLRERATGVISTIFRSTGGRLPIVGVGGVFSGEDAFEKISAGASLLQVYTGLVYRGPSMAGSIVSELTQLLASKGLTSIDEAVGTGASR